MSAATTLAKSDKFPPGIPYIIGNEAAERFSFYGMRAILKLHVAFLVLGVVFADIRGQESETVKSAYAKEVREKAEIQATNVYHLFIAGVYAFPMIGAILADRLLGKYKVIFWVSLIYCMGHAALAVAPGNMNVVLLGLALIALGSGGIKPCVSANVGDQFNQSNSHLVSKIYRIFYFSINVGSLSATMLIPWIYKKYGPDYAFALPGIAMLLATIVFWYGRKKFIHIPPRPAGKLGFIDFVASVLLFVPFALFAFFTQYTFKFDPASTWGAIALAYTKYVFVKYWLYFVLSVLSYVCWYLLFSYRQSIQPDVGFLAITLQAFRNRRKRKSGQGFFDVVRDQYGEDAEGPPAVLKIALVFSMVSVFWGLFDQHSSTWLEQAGQMNRSFSIFNWKFSLEASQTATTNPLFVLLFIPLISFGFFGPLERRGIVIKPLARMTGGMFITALSYVAIALIQMAINDAAKSDARISWLWQVIPYALLTLGEILVSTTGLEFAYTQAPKSMKSTVMGFWLLAVTCGNLIVAVLSPLQARGLSFFFWMFAILMFIASLFFAVIASLYKGKTYLQDGKTLSATADDETKRIFD